jgi:pyruvate-formate lyase-activating enzyme
MDVKDSFDTMTELTQSHINLQDAIQKSIDILSQCDIEYEFRTTISKPYHTKEKIEKIAILLQ